ncbi:MAG: PAS domain S-box protein, partial [Thermodesulfobacteriota bacterium]|nr:PAS domain S-box protein [Thermodesulfobacteriota bacterium]
FNRVYSTGQPTKVSDWIIRRKDGEERHVEASISLIKNPEGHRVGFRGIARDVTEKKKTEAELIRTKDFLQNIFNSSIDVITTTDLLGNVLYTSLKRKEVLGYEEEETIGRNVSSFYSNGKEDAKNIMKELTTNGELKNYKLKLIKKGGELIDISLSASFLRNEKGEIIGTLGIYRDITDQKRLEAQFQQAQRMKAIGTLSGGIAHDFNNLLMGIQGRTSLILMDADPSHPHFEHLKGIEEYVKSAADLTKQLLGFAMGGKYEIRSTDLNELIKMQNRLFGRTKKEITISGKYEKNLWPAEVDHGQIEQVLLNLYVNAWQSMPGGGNLYIRTENVTLDENDTKPFEVKPGKYIKISVTDTGIGMDEATRQRIFDPFFTTKEMGRGTGLGLASVYGIIKNHEGFITIRSEEGEGSSFYVYLPASEKEIKEDMRPTQEVQRGTETILLVDDEEMIINIGGELLKTMGYKVFKARGGEKAIELLREKKDRIDMVILDMIMPDMGGGETYDRMRQIDPNIKVLLSSGYSIDGQAKEILERGCNAFIQKPFNINQLSRKIREILGTNHL